MLRLKELRKKFKLSQGELAKEFHISQATLSAYELGDRTPNLDIVINMADFFNVSLDYFAGLSEIKQNLSYADLSSEEKEHLHNYRKLNDMEKEKVKSYIDGLRHK